MKNRINRLILIPGVGADSRAFSKLKINAQIHCVFVDWLPLENENESFESYCNRIIKTYSITAQDCLAGLSFGGLIAQHIAKVLGNNKVILISSFRDKHDLKPLMIFGLRFKLYKALPPFRIPVFTDMTAFLLNSWSNGSSASVLTAMLKTADFRFIKWCILQIDHISLSNSYSSGFLSFTGTNDKLVTNWKSQNHIIIAKGSHFMVYDHADEISKEINRYCSA